MTTILNADAMQRALSRMAHEILEHHDSIDRLALIGLQTRGVFLAQRLARKIFEITSREVPTATLDISMYRDDLDLRGTPPTVKNTDIAFDLNGRQVVLVDDVLFTGRSTRAAMDAITDLGRPQRIQLAVLIDRGHRELPIRADYVGKNVPTAGNEQIQVRMKEQDGEDLVTLQKEKA